MNTLVSEPLAKTIRFDADTMWVGLADGRQLGVPLAYFPRLLHASPAERGKYTTSGGGTELHWDALDGLMRTSRLPVSYWVSMIERELARQRKRKHPDYLMGIDILGCHIFCPSQKSHYTFIRTVPGFVQVF